MKHPYWRKNTPSVTDPTRPARIIATLVLRPGAQGVAPWLARAYLCDDGEIRVRVTR